MRRTDYLSQPDVAGFVDWAGHLVHGEWRLEHSWKGKGPRFQCGTLYEAFQRYRWPNSVNGDTFAGTMQEFDGFRETFNSIGDIATIDDQACFIRNARAILKWGNITLCLKDWGRMTPSQLHAQICDIKVRLDPACADTEDLRQFKYMGSGYSKIYSALIPGLPIYDSRVACALACLVRLYRQDAGLHRMPPLLDLGMPKGRGNVGGRCTMPAIRYGQKARYAKANLQFAWLMQGLTADPGDFSNLPESRRADAVQSALFMLGYERLASDAVVKHR